MGSHGHVLIRNMKLLKIQKPAIGHSLDMDEKKPPVPGHLHMEHNPAKQTLRLLLQKSIEEHTPLPFIQKIFLGLLFGHCRQAQKPMLVHAFLDLQGNHRHSSIPDGHDQILIRNGFSLHLIPLPGFVLPSQAGLPPEAPPSTPGPGPYR